MPSYPNCYYLCIKEKDGVRELLQGMMINDSSPGNEWFDSEISRLAVKVGLVDSPADLEARGLLQSLAVNTPAFLDSMTEMTLEEQKTVAEIITTQPVSMNYRISWWRKRFLPLILTVRPGHFQSLWQVILLFLVE